VISGAGPVVIQCKSYSKGAGKENEGEGDKGGGEGNKKGWGNQGEFEGR
jgi:hypothetical protein